MVKVDTGGWTRRDWTFEVKLESRVIGGPIVERQAMRGEYLRVREKLGTISNCREAGKGDGMLCWAGNGTVEAAKQRSVRYLLPPYAKSCQSYTRIPVIFTNRIGGSTSLRF